MDLAAQQTRARADLLTQRQVVASELADLRVRLAAIEAQRQRVERANPLNRLVAALPFQSQQTYNQAVKM
jgi:hypothetical protein